MFVTWDGTFANNPYGMGESHLLLFAGFSDVLVLAEMEDGRGYNRSTSDWHRSAGRSLTQGLRVQGNGQFGKEFWELSFLVNEAQKDLFNQLLYAQQNGIDPIVIEDYFSPAFAGVNVWIDVDSRYLTTFAGQSWWRLQFTALEI